MHFEHDFEGLGGMSCFNSTRGGGRGEVYIFFPEISRYRKEIK